VKRCLGGFLTGVVPSGAGVTTMFPCCAVRVGIAPVVGTATKKAVATREKIKRLIAKRHRHECVGA
jgi:hypothetical protein